MSPERTTPQSAAKIKTGLAAAEEALARLPPPTPEEQAWVDGLMERVTLPAPAAAESLGEAAALAAVRMRRLAELRERLDLTQADVARAMGVAQARVSKIERGELERTEVDTLAAYVRALDGRLKIVAEFGDEQYVLGDL
ncbi:XRE family transcriptional regulator [Streptomyces sp. NBC_00576]|uniref:XRE family transcriptional regulator n=1 Tax=Streptomyces sp. NBC_00576 TaxID=2903665 RepID=UPI002E815DD3|nr:XRE family transcriptional regulator [Streptomyces sp. NBC_00576]